MPSPILDLGRASCVELFASYGVDIQPTAEQPADCTTCCGIIGFVGSGVRGCIVLAASSEVLARSYPLEGSPTSDWAGELANQLLGRLKNRLLAYGIEIALSTPIVLRGFEITPVMSPRQPGEAFVCSTDGGVRIWIDVETEVGFELGDASEPPGISEGESILF